MELLHLAIELIQKWDRAKTSHGAHHSAWDITHRMRPVVQRLANHAGIQVCVTRVIDWRPQKKRFFTLPLTRWLGV